MSVWDEREARADSSIASTLRMQSRYFDQIAQNSADSSEGAKYRKGAADLRFVRELYIMGALTRVDADHWSAAARMVLQRRQDEIYAERVGRRDLKSQGSES